MRPLEASSAGQLVDTLVDAGSVTGAAALVPQGSETKEIAYGGSRLLRGEAAVDRSTLFDLASLTKPLSATLALVLDQSGAVVLISGGSNDEELTRIQSTVEGLLSSSAALETASAHGGAR